MEKRICFDSNWLFTLGNLLPKTPTEGWGGAKARAYNFGAAAIDADETDWKMVDLPHDFVSEGKYTTAASDSDMQAIPEMEAINSRHFAGGCLSGGVGWYRKHFDIPTEKAGQRIYIYFDGIYRNSTIYLNEYYIGSHASGYTGFYYDITDFVNYGGRNVIAVRVDATEREGWWYEGGGIYRNVWLEYRDNIAVEPYSMFIHSTPDLENNTAKIDIKAVIENYTIDRQSISVVLKIRDMYGNIKALINGGITVNAWGKSEFKANTEIDNITLWNLENPNLYSAALRICKGETLCDEVTVKFGIREMRFDAETGFYLNGKNIKIKGVCLHHDHAGVGIGVGKSVHEYRIKRMQEMGSNAIRSSHYPASPEMLDICDRLGMLVFEEQRRMSSAPEDLECLKAMVKRDRNHPSIFLWGIGNEEIFSQDRPETARATVTMKMAVRQLDPTRPVTSAVVCWNGNERFDNAKMYIPITKHLDIMGFNYCKTAWDDYHRRMPHQPIIITEASSNSGTRGCYNTDESKGQYYILDSNNINKVESKCKAVRKDMGESEWKYFINRPYLAGIFIWTGIDYRGEPTPLAYPSVYSHFGICDYCGFPKDNFYYYKSWWTDKAALHIFPHWNHSDGDVVNVHAYSNLDEVEIFVNGKSYGRKTMKKNWYLTWENVIYEKGELTAKGYQNGKEIITETIKTTDEPSKIELNPYKAAIKVGETAIINLRITDKNGLTVPTADNKITFSAEGACIILGTGNGNPADHDSEKTNIRCAFNGLCQFLVKATDKGEIKISASSEKLKCAESIITVSQDNA